MVCSQPMDRVARTIATGLGTVTIFYALFLPGGLPRRFWGGLFAAVGGLAIFLGSMALANWPLQSGHLQIATVIGMVGIYLTVEIPSRGLASFHRQPLSNVRGVTLVGMIVACFLAAFAAGMPQVQSELQGRQSTPPLPAENR